MTVALIGYASVFMRYSMAVTPKNYLLFACHFVNFNAQATQGYRYINYWHMGGKEAQEKTKGVQEGGKELLARAEKGIDGVVKEGEKAVEKVEKKLS